MCQMFGGPSKQEETNADQTQSFADMLKDNFSTQFTGQTKALGVLQNYVQRIATGDTGHGYNPELRADYVGEIQDQGAAQARNITQATQNAGAGQTFGGPSNTDSSGLARTRGTALQLKETALNQANAQTSSEMRKLDAADLLAGRENLLNATKSEQGVVNSYNPAEYAKLAGGELAQAGSDYHQINVEKTQKAQAIAKLAMSGITTGATALFGGIGALGAGESIGEGFKDFLGGAGNALSGGANPFSINPGGGGGSSSSSQTDNPWSVG